MPGGVAPEEKWNGRGIMDFSEFARAWEQDHREPTIAGDTISSCNNGVETTLFQCLSSVNVDLFFVVSDLLRIKDDRLKDFASLARQMLGENINTAMDFGPDFDQDLLYIEACEVIANSGSTRLEDIYLAEDDEESDSEFPWYGLTHQVIKEYGGIAAACAADALGLIALATILIRARRYQYAWCATLTAQSLVSYAAGRSLSEEGARLKYSENGKKGAEKRHQKTNELKEWTLAEYRKGKWPSANAAAYDLATKVYEKGKTIGATLSKPNAQRTIAEWIRKSV